MVRLPSCPFPPVIWMALALPHDTWELEAEESYTKQTWRNRFEIRGANKRQAITLPVVFPADGSRLTRDMLLATGDWRREHEKSLHTAYDSAPFADFYLEEIIDLIRTPKRTLWALNTSTLEWTARALGRKVTISQGSTFDPPDPGGLRAQFRTTKWKPTIPDYPQLGLERRPFETNLSVIDVLLHLGPESNAYLESVRAALVDSVSP